MTLRRFAPVAVAFGALACLPEVAQNSNPAYVDYAAFDPSTGDIPVPNDLAFAAIDSACSPAQPPCAQQELLQVFDAAGGFPNDQEVPISFGFVRVPTAGGATSAPDLDVASLKFCGIENGTPKLVPSCNLLFLRVDTALPKPVDDRTVELAYTGGAAGGTLVIRNKPDPGTGSRKWPAGARYVLALRAGPSGVKTVGGGTVSPQPTMYLLLQDRDLSLPENQGLIPGTPAEKAAAGLQLEFLRRAYALPPTGAPLSVFGLVDSAFPHREIADLTTFAVAPAAGTYVVVDESSGTVPLPSDLLLDAATGRVQRIDAFGPLADGIATLDGFSTTGMIMAPTSAPVRAATVVDPVNRSVFLFKSTGPGTWAPVVDVPVALGGGKTPPLLADTVLFEPPPITLDTGTGQPCVPPYGATTCLAPLVAIQPAVGGIPTPLGTAYLPPLEEATEYAVVITSRVKDAGGQGLIRSTVATILLLNSPIAANGRSLVAGIPDGQAVGLDQMRLAVASAIATLPAPLTKADVAMAYTFRTQSITDVALLLGAAPYQQAGSPPADVFPREPVPALTVSLTPAQAAQKYGVPTSTGLLTGVDHFVDTAIVTFDKLDPQTGAFLANPAAGAATAIPALVAVPAGTPPLGGWPLAVFHHGLGRSRGDALLVAGALAQGGVAAAAIDAAKHGDRSWCRTNADCAAGATCDHSVFGNQGDVACPPGSPPGCVPPDFLPGLCTAPGLSHRPVVTGLPTCSPTITTDCWDGTGGIALSSGSFLVSGNFFRWRDTVRQDVLDQSMLVRVLTTPEGQFVLGTTIDPTRVFYVGQSLGALEGTLDVAANPRISRAVLNVGGATWVDIGTTSPAFKPLVDQLLAGLGITPGTAEYLQFLHVAKWVLDPADPLNFARHLVASPLPNLLANPNGSVPQSPKAVLGQAARCDSVVPNATNQELYAVVGLSPLDPTTATTGAGLQWFMADTTTACPADGSTGAGGASHSFLLDFSNLSLTAQAQASAVGFLLGLSPSTPVLP